MTLLLLIPLIGFTVERLKLAAILFGFPVLGLMLTTVRRRVGLTAVPHTLKSLLQMSYAMICSVLVSFLVAGFAAPYADAHLIRADAMFGFAWLEHAAFVQDRPWLRRLLAVAYGTLAWQTPAAVAVLGLLGHTAADEDFHAGIHRVPWPLQFSFPEFYRPRLLTGISGLNHLQTIRSTSTIPDAFRLIEDIRGGAKRHLLGFDFDGIVTFPSFHTAAGVMLAWGFWSVRLLRWPMLAINAAMIASTPSIGAHYLVDVIAGVVMALMSIALAKRILRFDGRDGATAKA